MLPRDRTCFTLASVIVAASMLACGDDDGSATGAPVTSGGSGAGPSAMGNASPASGGSGGSAGAASGIGGTPSAGASGAPTGGSGGAATAGAGGAAGPVAGTTAADAAVAVTPDPSECDRACLLDFMKAYTDALVAHDPSKLEVSASLKYTENGVESELGGSVWTSAMSLVEDTLLTFADPAEGQVASQFVFNEGGSTQKIYQVRLKVVDREITEIESMVVMNGDQFFRPAGMKPEPVFLEMVDPAERTTREQLIAITELYLGYLEGAKSASEVPFDMSCKRYENGTATASGLSSFNAQSWSFDVTHRILVVDEEAGITWGMFPFQQSETALVVGEAFKIIDGKIMMIQAVMTYMPSKTWD